MANILTHKPKNRAYETTRIFDTFSKDFASIERGRKKKVWRVAGRACRKKDTTMEAVVEMDPTGKRPLGCPYLRREDRLKRLEDRWKSRSKSKSEGSSRRMGMDDGQFVVRNGLKGRNIPFLLKKNLEIITRKRKYHLIIAPEILQNKFWTIGPQLINLRVYIVCTFSSKFEMDCFFSIFLPTFFLDIFIIYNTTWCAP